MITLFALAGAIALIILVQLLRAMLALPLARQRISWLKQAPAPALASLYAELGGQLTALGFGEPRWLRVERVDGEPETMPLRAVYLSSDGCTRVWAAPPVAAKHPHRMALYFSDVLADGRTAISQAFDGYFKLLQGGDLVARTASEPTLAAQWQAHRQWLQTLGSPSRVIADDELLAHAQDFFESLRQRLIAQGQVRALTPDLAVPRMTLALRMLRTFLSSPKAPADNRPVPPERLALLARTQDIVRHRAPPRDVQWGLFLASVVMFMALGALLWDAQAALAILIVVILHELGHFLAMRAFGYKNVHILALPLVGGVAIGQDADPTASKRAWMSLMGPLPGIVIGWLLLALALISGGSFGAGWLLQLATVFLFINYLNVLPIPPLDGAHVVEALLPARWARVQTVFVGLAALIGAWLAWQFDFQLLTVLALLQLPALPGNWRLHGVERELATELAAEPQREARVLRVLQALEQSLGPTSLAAQRINQALHIIGRLDARPMGTLARLATGVVYAALLVVPVGALIWYGSNLF